MALRRIALALAAAIAGCGDDAGDLFRAGVENENDGGSQPARTPVPGVCDLSLCPTPATGAACCTPDARCGMDPLGLGLNCAPNPGELPADAVCDLADCPLPPIGDACCTPNARCGSDPFGSGLICFVNPPPINVGFDASVGEPEPTCELSACAQPEIGFACCLPGGGCGVDLTGLGVCFPEAATLDGGTLQPPPTTPPDDPSVTGDCPSYLGYFGPLWGCCSDFGICGSFAGGECLLPIDAQVPPGETDEDAGAPQPPLRCMPPD